MQQQEINDDVFPVVVIGGGLAGLTAAVHLAERDMMPLLIEADTTWAGGRLSGGIPNTFEYKGREWSFTTEHGAHALWGGYNNMRAMLERFFGTELLESTGEEWVNRWSTEVRYIEAGNAIRVRWMPAPFHYLQLLLRPRFWRTITPLDFLSLPGFMVSIIWTLGFDPLMEETPLDGLMMKEYFRGWTPNLRATFTGLGANLLAANEEAISLTGFIAALRFYTMLRRDDWRLDYVSGNSNDIIIQPMIDYIEDKEGAVQHGWRAHSLERTGDIWKIRVEDSRLGGMRSIEAQHVILAMNPGGTRAVMMNSPAMKDHIEEMRIPDEIHNLTVRMWFDIAPRDGAPGGMFTGDFMLDNFFWLHRLYDEFREWHEVTGGSAIEVHVYGRQDMLSLSERMLIITAIREVQLAFPELRGHLVHAAVRDNGSNHTRFIVPDENSLHIETPWAGIYACGDWIGYPTPSLWMERCTITGIAAANQVLQAYGKEPFEIIPPPVPELSVRILSRIIRVFRIILGPIILGIARLFRRKS